MRQTAFLISLCVVVTSLHLTGCANPAQTESAKEKREAYTDPGSGVTFPLRAGGLERVSMSTADDSDKVPVNAHYTRPDLLVDAAVRIIPSSQISPEQLLGQTMRAFENQPGFAESPYRGAQVFGNQRASCIECSFAQAPTGNGVIFKAVIVPRSNSLVCFTFTVPAPREEESQSTIDAFIRQILADSTGTVYMRPDFDVMKAHGDVGD